jgi:all-trans-retinol 13,14-reductase
MEDRVVIIGSGLGGLECGYILARHGFRVTIIEKAHTVGGCLQTFRRTTAGFGHIQSETFDTGFHYVGGLGEGESLYPLFKYLGLMGLPWRRMDPECFDQVCFEGDGKFEFANGDRFVERMAARLPEAREGFVKFKDFLAGVGDHIFDVFRTPGESRSMDLFGRSAYDFLKEVFDGDIAAIRAVSGTSLKMELGENLPLYVFAQINNSYIQSAWRLMGGGSQIAETLADAIVNMGGEILMNDRVTKLVPDGDRISFVETSQQDLIEADWVISDAHPAITLGLVGETKAIRKIYRDRICGLPNTYGMFTANIILKPETLPYMNRNLYIHARGADLWHPDTSRTESVLVHFYPVDGKWATHMDLISPMAVDEIEQWSSLPVGNRGEEYGEAKERKLREVIRLASTEIPGLKDAIAGVWTSTPITYESYTGTPEGSAYGIRKDWTRPMATVLSPRTPLRNLLMTGQSLNLHGVLGVSMTSVLTCGEILGLDTLSSEILGA